MDIMFILHAEHEMNCSTAAARHLASSGVDVYTAISGELLEWDVTKHQNSRNAEQHIIACSHMN